MPDRADARRRLGATIGKIEAAVIELYPAAAKAVVGPVREYESLLQRSVAQALSRGMTAAEFRADHRGWLREFAPLAFVDGLQAGGVDDTELSEEDQDTVDTWLKEQLGYTADFAAFVTGAKKLPPDERKIASDQAIQRAVWWVQSLETLRGLGRASAQKNMMVTWRLGRTEDHCTTCASLNGKRRRWKWFTDRDYIPQENGSETLECGGWNCDCRLVDDKGKQVMP